MTSEEQVKILCGKISYLISGNSESKLLLVIDQTEELLTLCKSQQEREDFLNLLAELLTKYPQQLRIVLALRSDFEPQLRDAVEETHWQKAWQEGRFFVTPMDREELQQAIEEPAAQRTLFFESPKLVNQLIDEAIDTPGTLPLLSFTLSELYLKYLQAEENRQRDDRTITETDYEQLGGVARSLTQTADKTYQELIEKEINSSTIRNVMLRMVSISSGELARRRVPMKELEYPEPINEQVQIIIDRFVAARLLVKGLDTEGQEYVEPVHDILVTGWTKIKYWLDEKENVKQISWWNPIKKLLKLSFLVRSEAEQALKVNLSLQRELNSAANRWESNKSVESLWNADPRLDLLKQLLHADDNWFNQVEAEFVQRSVGRKSFNIRLRRLIAIAVILGLSILTITASIARNEAQKQEIDALRQASEANWLANNQLEALIQILRAGKNLKENQFLQASENSKQREEVVQTLRKVVYGIRERDRLNKPVGQLLTVTPDHNVLIQNFSQEDIHYLNSEDEKVKLPKDFKFDSNSLNHNPGIIYSPDGKLAVTAHAATIPEDSKYVDEENSKKNGNVYLWDWESKKRSQTKLREVKNFQDRNIIGIGFTPDNQPRIATSNMHEAMHEADYRLLQLWDLQGNELSKFPGGTSEKQFSRVIFSPDSNQLAIESLLLNREKQLKKQVSVWDLNTNEVKPKKVEAWEDFIFNANSQLQLLISGPQSEPGSGEIALLTDLDGNQLTNFRQTQCQLKNGYSSIKISIIGTSSNTNLIASGDGDTVFLKDLQGNGLAKLKMPNQREIKSISFSGDGSLMAILLDDGSIRLWQIGDLDYLLSKGCNWVQDYLKNDSNLENSDHRLCDGIGGSEPNESVLDISQTATTPTLTQKAAVDLVKTWLQEKHKVFAPPFDLQVLARYTTGRYFQKSQKSVDWLKSNNAYYQFESPLVETTGIFSVEGNQATIGVKVTEVAVKVTESGSLSLYSQGQAKPSQNTTEYNFTLQLENGQWKIEDSQELTQ